MIVAKNSALLGVLIVCLANGVGCGRVEEAPRSVRWPSGVEFTVSADHAVRVGGRPVVERYEVRLYVEEEREPRVVLDVGKPEPDASGRVAVDVREMWRRVPRRGAVRVTVYAVGPGGETAGKGIRVR
jgi:hypothetical protein